MPAIAALAYHRASGRNISQPNQRLSYSENFLYMLDAANKPGCAAAMIVRFLPSARAPCPFSTSRLVWNAEPVAGTDTLSRQALHVARCIEAPKMHLPCRLPHA